MGRLGYRGQGLLLTFYAFCRCHRGEVLLLGQPTRIHGRLNVHDRLRHRLFVILVMLDDLRRGPYSLVHRIATLILQIYSAHLA